MRKFDDKRIIIHKKKTFNKIFSIIITGFIIGLIIFVGPVDALHLGLSGFKTTPYRVGEVINFLGSIDINSNERVPIQNVSLEVNDQIVCTFDLMGNKLSGCLGINVSLASGTSQLGYGYGYNTFEPNWSGSNSSSKAGNYAGYGYGYGYGNGGGQLVYNISIQTPQPYLHIPGNNELKLISKTPTQTFNSRIERIVVNPRGSNEEDSANLYIKEWYPKGRDYVFVCNSSFAAETYDWDYGDGQKLYDVTNRDTYHIFANDGHYMVSCTAWAPGHLAIAWMEVNALGNNTNYTFDRIIPV